MNETNLDIALTSGDVSFIMEDFKYLNKVTAQAEVLLRANLDSMNLFSLTTIF